MHTYTCADYTILHSCSAIIDRFLRHHCIFCRILKSLLEELIEKSVDNKPKLMLRRTESVVEKLLTNWLSIAMYGYVKVRTGSPSPCTATSR